MLLLLTSPAYADTQDDRHCGSEPKRSESGKILRSKTIRLEFERLYPLPVAANRDDWQVDHIIPLSTGGCDSIINMQWLPKSIKTCSGTICKDRWEREIYKRK